MNVFLESNLVIVKKKKTITYPLVSPPFQCFNPKTLLLYFFFFCNSTTSSSQFSYHKTNVNFSVPLKIKLHFFGVSFQFFFLWS